MVSSDAQTQPIYGHKLSTVGPGTVTGETAVYDFTDTDLLMKLHYLRGVYYFKGGDDGSSSPVSGLNTAALKGPTFPLFDTYTSASGRIRRRTSDGSGGGRPYVKCNDCGVRVVEAKCDRTVEEWVKEKGPWLHHAQLAPVNVVGPELQFSPLIFIQLTRFKCGGLAIGLGWSHILGDAFSAANFVNKWGRLVSGEKLPLEPQHLIEPKPKPEKPRKTSVDSVKEVSPVEDCWVVPNESKMETFSFQITPPKLNHLLSEVKQSHRCYSAFEAISAVIWQCLAPKKITICRTDTSSSNRYRLMSNNQTLSTIEADFPVAEAKLPKLAELIARETADESEAAGGLVNAESGLPDFIVYGANLTFVDLAGIEFYGFEMKGQKPVAVNYSVDGVGDGGAVLVLPAGGGGGGDGGRVVTATLPVEQAVRLQSELEREWGIA
ncbi:Rosmarinate synthase [Acorus calamus]|uniref:Rosmarinate synthase n=1 Tax=Acorus calamus TaxID=4465 RepID=A0AAV9CWP4_ACOCL|nr:Rosmarinate synthase [Acorus calamus]